MNKSKRQLNLYFQISEIYTISWNLTEQDLREVSEEVLGNNSGGYSIRSNDNPHTTFTDFTASWE